MPFDQAYVYGAVPPLAVTLAFPVLSPLHKTSDLLILVDGTSNIVAVTAVRVALMHDVVLSRVSA
jgi:hypothetical protein